MAHNSCHRGSLCIEVYGIGPVPFHQRVETLKLLFWGRVVTASLLSGELGKSGYIRVMKPPMDLSYSQLLQIVFMDIIYYAKDADALDIMLPTKDGKPDYETMERFISAIQKLVIKNVVQFTDRTA